MQEIKRHHSSSLLLSSDLRPPPHHSFCPPLPPPLGGGGSLVEAWFRARCCWLISSLAAAQWEQVEPPSPTTQTHTPHTLSCSHSTFQPKLPPTPARLHGDVHVEFLGFCSRPIGRPVASPVMTEHHRELSECEHRTTRTIEGFVENDLTL